MDLSLSEIKDWEKFQSLIKHLLEKLGYTVHLSGIGSDDGKDLLATSKVDDKIAKHSKKWVVQCKFYTKAVSLKDINDQNLPTLIYSYDATGYLLVVKNNVTAKLTKEFERLNEVDDLKLKFRYVVWQADDIKNKIINHSDLIEQFFPKYYAYNKKLMKK